MYQSMYFLFVYLSLASPLLTLIAGVFVYIKRPVSRTGTRRSIPLFMVGVLFSGLVTAFLAVVIRLSSIPGSGLEGLLAMIDVAPTSFTLGAALFLCIWGALGYPPPERD